VSSSTAVTDPGTAGTDAPLSVVAEDTTAGCAAADGTAVVSTAGMRTAIRSRASDRGAVESVRPAECMEFSCAWEPPPERVQPGHPVAGVYTE